MVRAYPPHEDHIKSMSYSSFDVQGQFLRASPAMEPYKYAPLQHADSTRLLTLHPGARASPIQISLIEIRLDDYFESESKFDDSSEWESASDDSSEDESEDATKDTSDHDLDDELHYEALSYTWATEAGDSERSVQIDCDGASICVTYANLPKLQRFNLFRATIPARLSQVQTKKYPKLMPMFCRKNCEAALRRLRNDRNGGRLLWVDAICIDQDNKKERGHQVGLMQDVYRRAGEVLGM